MITELTPAQEAKLEEYREKWIAIARQTEPQDKPSTETITNLVNEAYRVAGVEPPKEVIVARSPREITRLAFERFGKPGETFEEFYSNVRYSYGQHDAHMFAFYEYMREVLGLVAETENFQPLTNLAKVSGWAIFTEEAAFVSRRAVELHVNAAGQLHRDGGPAMLFEDDFKLFRLNGVYVPEEMVTTPADKLDPKLLLTITNVEVRREFVRKVGIVNLLSALNAEVLDTSHNGMYELVSLDLGDNRKRPYLKMKNPSINAIHVEGVPPTIKTVTEALAWRNGMDTFVKPETLT